MFLHVLWISIYHCNTVWNCDHVHLSESAVVKPSPPPVLKGQFTQNWFTCIYMFAILSSVEHKTRYSEECWRKSKSGRNKTCYESHASFTQSCSERGKFKQVWRWVNDERMSFWCELTLFITLNKTHESLVSWAQ